jgi:hypothetical protein
MVSQSRVEEISQESLEFRRFGVALAVASAGHDLDDRVHEGDGEFCIGACATVAEQIGDRMLGALLQSSSLIAYHARLHLRVSESHPTLQKNSRRCGGNDDEPKLRLTFLSIPCTALAGSHLTPRIPSTNAVALMYCSLETVHTGTLQESPEDHEAFCRSGPKLPAQRTQKTILRVCGAPSLIAEKRARVF